MGHKCVFSVNLYTINYTQLRLCCICFVYSSRISIVGAVLSAWLVGWAFTHYADL